MTLLRATFCAALVAGLALGQAHAKSASSTFDTDADGWTISNYDGIGSSAATWQAGTLQTGDAFSETSFRAPVKFIGDWSSAYGTALQFDLTETARDAGADAYYTALIASGAQTLYWYGGAPLPTFTTFVAPLLATDTRWRLGGSGFNPASGVAPSETQFLAILGNVTRLQINGEFVTGADNSRLDNVVLGAVPEPETYLMLLGGLAVLALKRRQSTRR